MNKIDTRSWHFFRVADFFDMQAGRYYAKDDYTDGNTPLVTSSDQNNGIMTMTNLTPLYSHCITIGKVNMSVFYQKRPFCVSSDVTVLVPKGEYSKSVLLFFVTLLLKERYRFNYGNQIRLNDALKLNVKLPVKAGGPDWDYMEAFINTHTHNYHFATKPASNLPTPELDTASWRYYELGELFTIGYGNSFELINLTETKHEGVLYISRTEKNNGVSAVVAKMPDVPPFKAGTITVAVSGSVLSTFLQTKPFYTGFHIMTLQPKEKMNNSTLLFVTNLIRREKYRFNYGRQANKSLKTLRIKLPTKAGRPDWDFMTQFIHTLPFSSQVK